MLTHGIHTLPPVPGFMDAARRYVAHMLTITFARLSKRQAGEALRLEGAQLEAYLAERVRGDLTAVCARLQSVSWAGAVPGGGSSDWLLGGAGEGWQQGRQQGQQSWLCTKALTTAAGAALQLTHLTRHSS